MNPPFLERLGIGISLAPLADKHRGQRTTVGTSEFLIPGS